MTLTEKEYYTAPSDKVFNEIKTTAIELWKIYDDTYGYQSEKVNAIKDLKNIKDNYAYIVGMFDSQNQVKLMKMIGSEEALILLTKLTGIDSEMLEYLKDYTDYQ